MVRRELEFRGIPLSHLALYFEELGAKRISDSFFQEENWSGEFLREEELLFTNVFRVNAVHIRFEARTKQELEHLINKYRFKTFRVGG